MQRSRVRFSKVTELERLFLIPDSNIIEGGGLATAVRLMVLEEDAEQARCLLAELQS